MSKFIKALKQLAEDAKTKPSQSICFRAIFRYDRCPETREAEQFLFTCFETMTLSYRQARKRRAIADRPTSISYEIIEVELVNN